MDKETYKKKENKIPPLGEKKGAWALILGGSSGLGLATAKKLARHGFNIVVVHRNRKADMPEIEGHFEAIRSYGVRCITFNADAVQQEKQRVLIKEMVASLQGEKIKVLVHSIAKGNLKPMHAKDGKVLDHQDFQLTVEAMGTSLYSWTQLLIKNDLFAEDIRVIAFTSEGNAKAWPGYAAVSAAKVTLEAIARSMALEFAPIGIKVNCIQAGTTDTKSFRAIPGSEVLKAAALKRNPNRRLTTPEDVADAVYLMTLDEAKWITGTVIKVDGGESLS